jgi:hypothetical protein
LQEFLKSEKEFLLSISNTMAVRIRHGTRMKVAELQVRLHWATKKWVVLEHLLVWDVFDVEQASLSEN